MKGPSFWCSASNSAKYWLKKNFNQRNRWWLLKPWQYLQLNRTRKEGQRSNLRINNCRTKHRRNPCAALPINIWIASNLRGEVSRRGEPLAVEPRHGGGSGEWGLQSRRRPGDWERYAAKKWRRGEEMVFAVWGGRKRGKKARCFRVQPAAAAASVGEERGGGVGRQPVPLWKPFSLSTLATRHDGFSCIKTKPAAKEKTWEKCPFLFIFFWN